MECNPPSKMLRVRLATGSVFIRLEYYIFDKTPLTEICTFLDRDFLKDLDSTIILISMTIFFIPDFVKFDMISQFVNR
jgi:hypothetical protein